MPPEGWQSTTLGAIARKDGYGLVDGPFGTDLPASDYVMSGVPVVRGSNLTLGGERFRDNEFVYVSHATAERLKRSLCTSDDIIFTKKGTLGQTALIPTNHRFKTFLVSSNQMKLSVDRAIADPLFVYYYVSCRVSREKIIRDAESTGVPKTNLTYLKQFPIQLPPINEQKVIASTLGTIDDKIELNRRMNDTLEALAQSIFKEWFVDATQNGLPKGWREQSVYSTADVIYGAPFSSARFNTEKHGKPLVRIRDLADESPEVWTEEIHPKGYLIKPGDIVVGMDGEFRAHVWGGAESWLNQRVCVFAPKQGFSAAFVLHSIKDHLAEVEATETATTVIHLGKNDIDRFKVVIPPKQLLEKYNEVAQPLLQRIVLNKQESRTLAELRDALLPKLLSGKIRVKVEG